MRFKMIYFIFSFVYAVILSGKTGIDFSAGWNLLNLKRLQSQKISTLQITNDGDLVIGQNNPDEVVHISGAYTQNGNITIMGNGILNITNADFRLDGDIFILGSGQMNITGGKFTVVQEYIYEHNAVIIDNAVLRFNEVDFQSSGQSWSIAATNEAEYAMRASTVNDGFITATFLENASADIHACDTPGEFLCFNRASVSLTNSDFLLMWLVLPENSFVDMTLPGDSLVTDWTFSNHLPEVNGLEWEASIDSCTDVMWGLISISGSDACFRDTDFRTIGLLFSHPDSINVSNITNESAHTDEIIRVEDRNLRLINSTVQTWSVYGSASAIVGIQNCIVGEIMAMDSSRIWVDNSICDGTGGYASTFQHGFLVFSSSLIRSQLIARDNSVLVAAMSSVLGTDIDADEEAIMFLANTDWFTEPEAHHSANIFEAQMPYFEGDIGSSVPIFGTARVLSGPTSPVEFTGYQIHYSPPSDTALTIPIPSFQNESVMNGRLAEWNTHDLEAGTYTLTLSLYHNFGDSISMGSWARLNAPAKISEDTKNHVTGFELGKNYPNPFNGSTCIPFRLHEPSRIAISLFDIRGRRIQWIDLSEFEAGEHAVQISAEDLPSGHYYYVVSGNNFKQSGAMQVVK